VGPMESSIEQQRETGGLAK